MTWEGLHLVGFAKSLLSPHTIAGEQMLLGSDATLQYGSLELKPALVLFVVQSKPGTEDNWMRRIPYLRS